MTLIRHLGSEFPGHPPAAVFYKSNPDRLCSPIIEAIARSNSGAHFFGPAADDGSYVTRLLNPSAWAIAPTPIASHECLSFIHSGVVFTHAYFADFNCYGSQDRLLLAIDADDRLHLELLSIADNDDFAFSAAARERQLDAVRSRSGPG